MSINWDLTGFFFNSDFQTTFVHEGTTYNGVLYTNSKENEVVFSGERRKNELQLLCKISDVTPAVDDEVTISGVTYYVTNIKQDSRRVTNIMSITND